MIGFSSITSTDLFVLKIVSKRVVPDLGKPIKKIGSENSLLSFEMFQLFKLKSLKKSILLFTYFRKFFSSISLP